MNNKLDIVTVTYNSSANLKGFFESLYHNIDEIDNIYIIDNNSKDDTINLIKNLSEKYNLDKKVNIIKNNKNLGYSAAINIGIKLSIKNSQNNLVAITNNDIIYKPNALKMLIEMVNYSGSDATGIVVTNDNQNYKLGYTVNERTYSRNEILTNSNIDNVIEFPHGGFILFRKVFFNKIGFYDDELFFGGDEIDFLFRVKKYNSKNEDKIKCYCCLESMDMIDHLSKHDGRYKLKKATRMLQGNARVYIKHKYKPFNLGLLKEQWSEIKILSKNKPERILILSILSIRGILIEAYKYYFKR